MNQENSNQLKETKEVMDDYNLQISQQALSHMLNIEKSEDLLKHWQIRTQFCFNYRISNYLQAQITGDLLILIWYSCSFRQYAFTSFLLISIITTTITIIPYTIDTYDLKLITFGLYNIFFSKTNIFCIFWFL